jgi:predicted TIM-barrel fold metal-dependent hydrolase
MGEVDLHFKSSVPTFDACVALGRRYDRYVREDTAEGTLAVMDKAGVEKALVYSPHAIDFDAEEGNALLMEQIQGQSRLVPQFVANASYDNMDTFGSMLHELSVRSVRMAPAKHRYPFRDWVVGSWMEWLASEKLPLWLDALQFDPVDLHDTAKAFPETTIVLSEVHYSNIGWALPLLKELPNVYIELSRFLIPDGVNILIDAIGADRVMFGSRFPDSPMAPMLYSLHRSSLSDDELRAICSGNIERLLATD